MKAVDDDAAPPRRALFYRYYRDLAGADDAAEFSLCGDEMAYVFPSDGHVRCVAVSINLRTYAEIRGALTAGFERRIAAHAGIGARVADATAVSRVLGCGPERSYLRRPWGSGWALVGDAGMHTDPFAGRGIDFAARHATFLAESLAGWLDGATTLDAALEEYARRRDTQAREEYRAITALARDLRRLA